jgi:hypothetical protein
MSASKSLAKYAAPSAAMNLRQSSYGIEYTAAFHFGHNSD